MNKIFTNGNRLFQQSIWSSQKHFHFHFQLRVLEKLHTISHIGIDPSMKSIIVLFMSLYKLYIDLIYEK